MARLSLSFLGPPLVTLEGEPVGGIAAKALALLAYLAIESHRPHSREALAGMLWPDSTHEAASSSLRATLYALRGHIGDRGAAKPALRAAGATIQFDAGSDHFLDVTAMREAAASRQDRSEEAISCLEGAVALYRGPLLQDCPSGDSEPFEDWLLLRRDELEARALALLSLLAGWLEAAGDHGRAERYLRRHLELAPWSEEAHRGLMRLLALSGRRGAALAQYDVCRKALERELAAEPEPLTVALYRSILAGGWPGSAARPPEVLPAPRPLTRGAPAPFVAREVELERLNGLLAEAIGGRGRVAFVTGEPGSGKTMLLHEFARRALDEHPELLVAWGAGNAYTGPGDPYLPFIQALQALAGDAEAGRVVSEEHGRRLRSCAHLAARALMLHGRDLIDVFVSAASLPVAAPVGVAKPRPEHLAQPAGRGPARAAGVGAGEGALLEQYARVLLAVAQRQPLVLVLDDLQWADSGSTNLLFHLGRRAPDGSLLLIGAYRPGDIAQGDGAGHPLERVVHELGGVPDNVTVDLDQADGRAFVDALVDAEPNRLGPDFRRRLYRCTGGHALFATELLQGLRRRGDVAHDHDGLWIAAQALDWERLPPRVMAVVGERLGALPESLRRLLAVASVQGEEFYAEVVALAQRTDPARVRRLLSEVLARRQRLVLPEGREQVGQTVLSRYRFRHHLFQRHLYAGLDEVERPGLHEATGRALEAICGDPVEGRAVALARHFEEAGLAWEAARYCHIAGERAIALSDFAQAVTQFRRALKLLEAVPASRERDRLELALLTALFAPLAATTADHDREQIANRDRIVSLYGGVVHAPELFPALYVAVMDFASRGLLHEVEELWPHLLDAAAHSEHAWAPAVAELYAGALAWIRGELRQAESQVRRAIAMSDAVEHWDAGIIGYPHDPRADWRMFVSTVLTAMGYYEQARHWAEEALAMAHAIGHRYTLSEVQMCSALFDYQVHREPIRLRQQLRHLQQSAAEHGGARARLLTDWLLGLAHLLEGKADEAVPLLAETVACVTQPLDHRLRLCGWLAEAHRRAGQVDAGLAVIEAAMRESANTGVACLDAELCRERAELLLRRAGPGDAAEAESWLRRAMALAQQQEAKLFELRAATTLARLWRDQGKREEARHLLAGVYGWFTEGFDAYDLRQARALLDELE